MVQELACQYSSKVGNAEFEKWWAVQGGWVEEPNQRRGGVSGVQLLHRSEERCLPVYIKKQTGHIYRSLRYPLGRPTILREKEVYETFSTIGVRTPRMIFSEARKYDGEWQALLITESLDGYVNLEQWFSDLHDKELNDLLIKELAITLARMHESGWQHGCCYPKHIFVKASSDVLDNVRIDVALLDLEKSRRRWTVKKAAEKDLNQLIRHRGNIPLAALLILQRLHDEYLMLN
ncbi:lipopolysaccharide kinase InaA family protein [Ectopseudomonas mendocina]|uniref:Lipopolysaccharide kinase InaA family protein n=1 Tax=Ectopseudomonas mendocina TaxID=300 RepID=A0ABZ2RLR6_ECTME